MTRSLEIAESRRLAGTFILSLVLGLALLSPASAQPMPKIGACPSDYHHSGGYCAPSSTAGPAIAKTGQCPSESHASGGYCLGQKGGSARRCIAVVARLKPPRNSPRRSAAEEKGGPEAPPQKVFVAGRQPRRKLPLERRTHSSLGRPGVAGGEPRRRLAVNGPISPRHLSMFRVARAWPQKKSHEWAACLTGECEAAPGDLIRYAPVRRS